MPDQDALFYFPSDRIERHLCAKCQAQMTLAHTNPARLGFDLLTFACMNCANVEKVTEATLAHKWRSSGLNPPT